MKRFLVMLIALAALAAFAGCGGGSGDSNPGGGDGAGGGDTGGSESPLPDEPEDESVEPTAVYDYYENEAYVVYKDTSLYFGNYNRDAESDLCSNNVFVGTLSDTMEITSISNESIIFQSDSFAAFFELNDEYPHFDGVDRLRYWYFDGTMMCVTSIGSLPVGSSYDDIWIFVCSVIGGDPCGVVYDRRNPSALKSFGETAGAIEIEVIESEIDRLEESLVDRMGGF